MKHLIVFLLLLTTFPTPRIAAQNGTRAFGFKPKKVAAGTVYHYLKTNIDGTQPEHVSQFVADEKYLEAFKFHEKGERAGLVVAEMDWNLFSVRKLESWQVWATERKLFATLEYLDAEKTVEVSIGGKKAGRTAIKFLPFHVYNFDFGSLNMAFPHLKDPKKSFTVGIADPTFKNDGEIFTYRGEATVVFVGDEPRNNAKCRKYRIDGAGLENRGGFIWVNKKGGHIEDMEIDLPDNPEWKSFKFKLVRTEKMNRDGWEKFIEAQF
jgi:hypothetical protein